MGGLGLQAMGIEWGTYVLVGSIFLLLLSGLPLAFVTGLVALVFTVGWFGPNAIPLVISRVYGFITEYSLVAVPMFVLMASLLDRSGIARDLFSGMRVLAGRLPGGVAIQTLVVAVFLAAMSGIIGGEIVLLGILALPQMLRLGYDRKIAIGVVCGGGSLGTMIPPSIVLIIYGLIASVSIADLFVAAVTPGVLLAGLYMTYVFDPLHAESGAGAGDAAVAGRRAGAGSHQGDQGGYPAGGHRLHGARHHLCRHRQRHGRPRPWASSASWRRRCSGANSPSSWSMTASCRR